MYVPHKSMKDATHVAKEGASTSRVPAPSAPTALAALVAPSRSGKALPATTPLGLVVPSIGPRGFPTASVVVDVSTLSPSNPSPLSVVDASHLREAALGWQMSIWLILLVV